MRFLRERLFWRRLKRCVYVDRAEYEAAMAAFIARGGETDAYDPVPIYGGSSWPPEQPGHIR